MRLVPLVFYAAAAAAYAAHFAWRDPRIGRFATGLLGQLHTDTGAFRWLNAGHPLPLLIRDGHVRSLTCHPRLPFGIGHMQPDRDWEIAEDQLQPGDGLLLFTDGVVEARKPGGEDFGLDRLMEFLHTAFAAGLARLPESRNPAGGRADWPGTTLITAALTALMFALIRGKSWAGEARRSWPSSRLPPWHSPGSSSMSCASPTRPALRSACSGTPNTTRSTIRSIASCSRPSARR